MICAGIISDTHLYEVTDRFIEQCNLAFAQCSVIIHAGDLTEASILSVFEGKEIYGVHGNMCSSSVHKILPRTNSFQLEEVKLGLFHGAWGSRHNIEDRAWDLFPSADCIIYGHTHQPVCHQVGKTTFINPGSFQGTGRYGSPGSYAIMEINKDQIRAALHTLPQPS
ncbi:MAG: YfcE family phosphodiesterase [Thermodesulfobacteriota bacterium]